MSKLELYVGNKNYSSWSLRGWLAVRLSGAPFEDFVIPLDRPETKFEILKRSPTGRVPVLHHEGRVIWDSLAICEYIAELFPEAALWPADRGARAVARSISAEMHSGFQALRGHYPMNIRRRVSGRIATPEAARDIERITAIWTDCRARFGAGGPYLFGSSFGIADAMYAPVVTRFATYELPLDPVPAAYRDAVLGHPAVEEWCRAARAETLVVPNDEV